MGRRIEAANPEKSGKTTSKSPSEMFSHEHSRPVSSDTKMNSSPSIALAPSLLRRCIGWIVGTGWIARISWTVGVGRIDRSVRGRRTIWDRYPPCCTPVEISEYGGKKNQNFVQIFAKEGFEPGCRILLAGAGVATLVGNRYVAPQGE